MTFSILTALALAKVKRFKLAPAFRTPWLYPLLAAELVYLFFQASALAGNYAYLRWALTLQRVYMLTAVVPILALGLYKPALAGAGCVALGTALNRIVMAANGGRMPVYATLSRFTGYYDEAALTAGVDNIHIVADDSVRLFFLSDYIDTGFSILSPGDVLIHAFIAIIVFFSVRECHRRLIQKRTDYVIKKE